MFTLSSFGVHKQRDTKALPDHPRVFLLYPHHRPAVAGPLSRAFADDFLIWAILPPGLEPADRIRRMSGLFTAMRKI